MNAAVSAPARILIVEDEAAIRELLVVNLTHAGHTVIEAVDAAEAIRQIEVQRPDLLVLDWMLPDVPGTDLARQLRSAPATQDLPIIMLTARGQEGDRLYGFDAGVDDYVSKPFSPRELLARIRALLRRAGNDGEPASPPALDIAGLTLEPDNFRVLAHGQPLKLGPTEYRLLQQLMQHPDRVRSRTQLLDAVWGNDASIGERTVDVHIRRLRLALQPGGHDRLIETVRGGGYRMLPRLPES
ncbi:MAG: phosphate regulon transcriptional regulator PhoB [Lautropia sp.]|nr:phosphate regulon transcriptional regulator PhoB [Lautropia sp.]